MREGRLVWSVKETGWTKIQGGNEKTGKEEERKKTNMTSVEDKWRRRKQTWSWAQMEGEMKDRLFWKHCRERSADRGEMQRDYDRDDDDGRMANGWERDWLTGWGQRDAELVCLDADSDEQEQTAPDKESKWIVKEMPGLVEVCSSASLHIMMICCYFQHAAQTVPVEDYGPLPVHTDSTNNRCNLEEDWQPSHWLDPLAVAAPWDWLLWHLVHTPGPGPQRMNCNYFHPLTFHLAPSRCHIFILSSILVCKYLQSKWHSL